MTSTELAVVGQPATTLHAQMDYARAVSVAAMLPDNYRNKPADIMLAVGLGQSMGLSPAESLYRISVIKGKPTASAELIAANVRKAGHRLRVSGDDSSATATIIRADDPDYEFTVTRDIAWAQKMGLHDQPNYRKQPGTMLQWRAITAVARLACPEALYGVAYSSEEMGDLPDTRSGGLAAALSTTAEQVHDGSTGPLPDLPESAYPDDALPLPTDVLLNTSSKLAKAMYASIHEAGVPEDERIAWLSNVIGREIGSSKEMTEDEARMVLAFIDEQKGQAS